MSHETLGRMEDDAIKPEPTPEQDMLTKALFDSGISKLEHDTWILESNTASAKAMLETAKLNNDRDSQKAIEHQISANEETLGRAHWQLVELYKALAQTIDRKLLSVLRYHLIHTQANEIHTLTPEERKDVLDTLAKRK